MNRMKRLLIAPLALAFVFGLMAQFAHAADEAKLPERTVFYVQTAPITQFIKDLESGAGTLLKGMPPPIGMMAMPGTLEQYMTQATGLPLNLLDKSKGIHFLLLSNAEDPEDPPTTAVLIPVADYAAMIDAIKKSGMNVEDSDDIQAVTGGPEEYYFSDLGNGYALASPTLDDAKAALPSVKDWTPKAAADGVTISQYTDVAFLCDTFNDDMDTGVAEMIKELGEKSPIEGLDLAAALKPMIEGIVDVAKQTDMGKVDITINATSIQIKTFVAARDESKFASFITLMKPEPLPVERYTLLPADSLITSVATVNQEATAMVTPVVEQMLKTFFTAFDQENGETLVDQLMSLSTKQENVVAGIRMNSPKDQSAIKYIKTEDPVAYIASIAKVLPEMNSFMKKVIDKVMEEQGADDKTTVTLEFITKVKAGTIEGVDYASIGMNLELTSKNGEELPAEVKEQIAAVTEGNSMLLAAVDGVVVVASGKDREDSLKSAILALKNKTAGIGNTPLFMEPVTARQGKSNTVTVVDLPSLVKSIATGALEKMPAMPQKQMLEQIVDQVAKGTSPFVIASGMEDNMLVSEIVLPLADLNALSMQGMQAYMYMMMIEQQAGPMDQPDMGDEPDTDEPTDVDDELDNL